MWIYYFCRPQHSCGKVMFSQASVILFTGGVYPSMHWGRHPPRQTPLPWADPPPPTATAAEGTHPTGMHSSNNTFSLHNVLACQHSISVISMEFENFKMSVRRQKAHWKEKYFTDSTQMNKPILLPSVLLWNS